MTGQSAFDKQKLQEIAPHGFSALLEHLNLPPAVVRFVKKNDKKLRNGAILIAVLVIGVTMYSSYRANRIEKASAALAVAMQTTGAERQERLRAVAADFSGTPSALWADAEIAHGLVREGKYREAAGIYQAVRKKISSSDPLFALLSFALAQANEAARDLESAILEYKALQKIGGYEGEGVTGLARIYESQGKGREALAVYEEYLATFPGQEINNPARVALEEKIATMKASL